MADSILSRNRGRGKGFTEKLQSVLDPVNQLLTDAAREGLGFELYMRTFPRGDAATYHIPRDRSEGESASAGCVSLIEILDVYERDPINGACNREMQNGEITYSTISGDLISIQELGTRLFAVNEYLEGAKSIGKTLIASPETDAEVAGILRMFLSSIDGMSNEITKVYPEVRP